MGRGGDRNDDKYLGLINFNSTDASSIDSITYSVWSNFRIYGNIILVIAMLVIVLAETIGGGLIDAYTVRKMLPRILVTRILGGAPSFAVVAKGGSLA